MSLQRGSLCQAAWPGAAVELNNVHVHIATLRQRLGARHIVNVARRGYRWQGPVVEGGPPPGPALIGRDAKLRSLQQLVVRHRLVKVAGGGGIGKTSLVHAWRHAAQAAAAHAAAPVLVELAALTTAAGVAQAVAQAATRATAPLHAAATEAAAAAAAAAGDADLPDLVATAAA